MTPRSQTQEGDPGNGNDSEVEHIEPQGWAPADSAWLLLHISWQ